ncbi:DUF6301 family protein [Nocardia brasiliensis]|uniref:DUF6301 family protein n=1 Tax=Nocardia brasiliensis TaxID=37326 RepID=UPI0018963C52|nr:DUF6301 family protein [Nocardia brasiliensis]MBF6547666.1 hypothetical protein [Nocardia brasiliensis]
MTDWAEFTEGITEHLATLPVGLVVIISEDEPLPKRCRSAQFRQLDDMIWAELVGDSWLEPNFRAVAGGRFIGEACWQQPDADHCDNWWFELPWPADSGDYERLAARIATGLRDGFGISEPRRLIYRAWKERDGNRTVELPLLGIAYGEPRVADTDTRPSEQRVMGDEDIIELANKLYTLRWPWRMDYLVMLLDVFRWRDPMIRSPDWVRFDAGLGSGTCDVIGRAGDAERIEAAVTTLFPDDAQGWAGIDDAFTRMSSTLIAAIGEPTARIAGKFPEIRWGGVENTLRLTNLVVMVHLDLVTNEWLAEFDVAH